MHAVSSVASGPAGAAGEGVVDQSNISRRGGKELGGQRELEGAAPAQAPLLSAPKGSERLEGISVEEAMVTRTQLLEEELSSLKEELALCQVSRTPVAGLSSPQRGRGLWGGATLSLCLWLRSGAGWGLGHPARRRSLPAPTPGAAGFRRWRTAVAWLPYRCPSLDTRRAEFVWAPRAWLSVGYHQ